MPTDIINNCHNKECNNFFSETKKFLEQTKISSITFDYSGYNSIFDQKYFKSLKWNIWNVDSINSFNKILTNDNIGIILLKNNKFSNNLN